VRRDATASGTLSRALRKDEQPFITWTRVTGRECSIHTVYTWLSGEAVKRTGKRATAGFALEMLP
jgi:hypothetical protein